MNKIPQNTLCADGRNIAAQREEALERHRAFRLVQILALERRHMASCPTCNPELALIASLFKRVGPVQVRG